MQILKNGSAGAEVSLLQLGLVRAGADTLKKDGLFGPATEAAVRAFQKKHALVPDGIFGPRTYTALEPWLLGVREHVIAPGDTLWRLAYRYGVSLSALETANPALDPFALMPGQRLTVPFPFPVVPTDIPWCSELNELCVRGLAARYPRLRRRVVTHSGRVTPIFALTIGDGPRRVLYNAAHHANEWITAPLLMKYAEALLEAYSEGGAVAGTPAEELLDRCSITLVPLVNPDGVDLVTGALPPQARAGAEEIAAAWPAIPFPGGWKADLQGVDLNLQYPAMWELAREIKFAQGFTGPAPRDYVGPAPLSAPESRGMADFTRRIDPALTLAFHTQGKVIYWEFMGSAPAGSRELVETLGRVSGYTPAIVPAGSGYAGYKDWFISAFGRPGFTVEAGEGTNPLPLEQFDEIWRDCVPLMNAAALGE